MQQAQTQVMNENKEYDKYFADTFEEMNLKEEVLRGIYAYGFEKPSLIQKKAILPFIDGNDLIAQSQSGTGKTGTFSISVLQRIDSTKKETQAIVLCPTRELAEQSARVMMTIGQFMPDLQVQTCIGGVSRKEQIDNIVKGAQVIVGTPGRIVDFLQNKVLDPDTIKVLVMDEADEILSEGFAEQIKEIVCSLPTTAQCGVYSATLKPEVLDVTRKFMRNPYHILVPKEELTLDGIKQTYIFMRNEIDKVDTISDLYEGVTISQAIIFCNRKETVEMLKKKLTERDFVVCTIHGEMEQSERNAIIRDFRSGSARILIATDIVGRGLDVQHVSLVINYDLPSNKDNYIHRIGRSGRFGRKGFAINFTTSRDFRYMKKIEQFYETQITELTNDDLKNI
jgi:translation initiation factor 4A